MAALAQAANCSATHGLSRVATPSCQNEGSCLHIPHLQSALTQRHRTTDSIDQFRWVKSRILLKPLNARRQHVVSAVASVEAQPEVQEQQLEGVQKLWNAAKVIGTEEVAPGVQLVTLETEISREIVPLESSYMLPGETAQVKLASGSTEEAIPACPPFEAQKNKDVLLKLRGDIQAGATKVAMYTMSVKAPLELWVEERKAPGLWGLKEGDDVEVGPFKKTGMDIKPILFLTRFPTVLMFARGTGLAAARALVEAKDTGSLNFLLRQEGRLYLSAPTPSELPFKNLWPSWEKNNVKVKPTVDDTKGESWDGFVGDLKNAFDEDDLEYEPDQTAVVVCGDAATIDEVLELLQEAEIPDSQLVRWQTP